MNDYSDENEYIVEFNGIETDIRNIYPGFKHLTNDQLFKIALQHVSLTYPTKIDTELFGSITAERFFRLYKVREKMLQVYGDY